MVPVFLGEDNSVKLGDFGLSKLMQSHDFASTYVGTPFYMSPEICAAERYTLQSDIWSLGCIMYELCARHPPFNAKTHFHLVQKIKEGRYDPLPSIYSPELQNIVKSCLKINPSQRPDTATLLNLPIVRLFRKERQVVELGQILRSKEEETARKKKEAEERLAGMAGEQEKIKMEFESSLRREWEVKARLEIDRQVLVETERLKKQFDMDFKARIKIELDKQASLNNSRNPSRTASGNHSPADIPIPSSSVSTYNEADFPSVSDLSAIMIDTPPTEPPNPLPTKRMSRTPFTRAKTQFDSPMDFQMAEASPMSIASLSLSPRRVAAVNRNPPKNIFTLAAEQRGKWRPHRLSSSLSEDEELEDDADDVPDLPSPTRLPRSATGVQDPFKPTRKPLVRQITMPVQRLMTQPPLFAVNNTAPAPVQAHSPTGARAPKSFSPNRPAPTSPARRLLTKAPPKPHKANAGGEDLMKAALRNNMGGGRTLVELQQARAGGAPVASLKGAEDKETPIWDPERDEMPSPFLARVRRPTGAGMGYGVGR